MLHTIRGVNESAIADLNQALALDPENPELYLARGNYYSSVNESEKAIDDFSEAIALFPYYVEAYFLRAATYANLNDDENAVSDFRKALDMAGSGELRELIIESLKELNAYP